MRKLIKVTKKHIKNGIPLDKYKCPVAKAILENVFANYSVRVTSSYIEISAPESWCGYFYYKVPRSVQRFIRKFDSINVKKHKMAQPFNFYLVRN